MASLEERMQALEQALEQESMKRQEREQALERENAALKEKIELHTIAIGGLINKAALEALNEKHDKIFKALEAHDQLTNTQLAELREKVEVDIEGKIVGVQTEMRQRFTQVETTLQEHSTALAEQKDLLTEQKNMLTEQKDLLTAILARLPEK